MDKYLINRIKQLELLKELRQQAWQNPDPLSRALHEVRKDELMELAAGLDAQGTRC